VERAVARVVTSMSERADEATASIRREATIERVPATPRASATLMDAALPTE
jgi:hypothetical protein